MKMPIAKPVQVREEYYIEFTDEELAALKMKKGQKFSCSLENGGLKMVPYATMELDMSDWSREILEYLIEESCEQDISVNEVIEKVITNFAEFENGRKKNKLA